VESSFDYFVKKIPADIHNNTNSVITRHIAIFISESFVIDRKLFIDDYHFVICVTEPPGATIRSKEYQFKKGSLICLAPGDDIVVHPSKSSAPSKFMSICVNKKFMQDIYQQTGGVGTLSFKKPDSAYSYFLLEAIEALTHEVLNYGVTNHLMIESLENRIAIQLLRNANPELYARSNKLKTSRDNVQMAVKYIETYFSSNITIKDVCDAVYIGPPYLQKIFLQCTGITLHQYIIECRHRKAKEMLQNTAFSIEKAAMLCGFVNSAHFSTVFKQREGISPLS
jgi:AraC family transcriptional regulator